MASKGGDKNKKPDPLAAERTSGPSEDEVYFMAVALLFANKSPDPSTKVGACIVNKECKIVGVGYNKMPDGCEKAFPWAREAENKLDTKYPYGETGRGFLLEIQSYFYVTTRSPSRLKQLFTSICSLLNCDMRQCADKKMQPVKFVSVASRSHGGHGEQVWNVRRHLLTCSYRLLLKPRAVAFWTDARIPRSAYDACELQRRH
ncbi:Deoxycytidylate deaminase [Bagarius yarrelli]|uniref:dCMP deaminase n=1 Tax=Bagarius yarrelli TaxID=175774 RepID=A0A556VWM9_BAGYA|nr:Deoxycytidylate deaminase [Bagarius yarrelli]